MARKAKTEFQPNDQWFDTFMKSDAVLAVAREPGDATMNTAKSNAPVDSGDYRDRIHIEVRESKFRKVIRIVASDPKSLLVEAKTGNLARALKAAKK